MLSRVWRFLTRPVDGPVEWIQKFYIECACDACMEKVRICQLYGERHD